MKADIKRFASQWFLTPHDGVRGGIAVASRRAALALCVEHGWEPVEHEDGFARRSRLIAESMDIAEKRHGRVR